MPLLSSPTVSSSPLLFSSPSKPQGLTYRGLGIEKEKNVCSQRTVLPRLISAGDGKEWFIRREIEFPTAGLDSVPGDGEGGIEMTGSMQLIREFVIWSSVRRNTHGPE
ncbi:UNVERIFIED_CONTAM: hypothetical protein Scaly_0876400 [Sesamum calycinum]|uniref:Uncharacterized protein n=1 Tax=Sesamum calycinum TaxID=2727403 RepID=A0AAW2QX16_9LAMI